MIPTTDPRRAPIGADHVDSLGRWHSGHPSGTILCRHLTEDRTPGIAGQCARCACSLCAACAAPCAGNEYLVCPECDDWQDGRWGAAEVAAELGVTVRRVEALAASRQVGRFVGGRLIFTAAAVAAMR